jgi:hypothetical protein
MTDRNNAPDLSAATPAAVENDFVIGRKRGACDNLNCLRSNAGCDAASWHACIRKQKSGQE